MKASVEDVLEVAGVLVAGCLTAAFLAACSGTTLSSIPLPIGGSITVSDGGATVCTTIPLGVAVDAGIVH